MYQKRKRPCTYLISRLAVQKTPNDHYTIVQWVRLQKAQHWPATPLGSAKTTFDVPLLIYLFRLGLAEKYDYLLQFMSRIAGGEPIGFNNSVFLSERQTADRQPFAIFNLLITFKGQK
jgi:hypothetical protein